MSPRELSSIQKSPQFFTPHDSLDGDIIVALTTYDGGEIFVVLRGGKGKRHWGLLTDPKLADKYRKAGPPSPPFHTYREAALKLYEGLIRDQFCPFDPTYGTNRKVSRQRDSRLQSGPTASVFSSPTPNNPHFAGARTYSKTPHHGAPQSSTLGDDESKSNDDEGIVAGDVTPRDLPTGDASSLTQAISDLNQAAVARNLDQDAALRELSQRHARDMADQVSSNQVKNEAESSSTARQYDRLINNEETRLQVEKDRVELQREQNNHQMAMYELDRKRLGLEEAKMSQRVDTELTKRIGVPFSPYDDHRLFLIRGRRSDAGICQVGHRCAETSSHLLVATRSPGRGAPLLPHSLDTRNGGLVYRSDQTHRIIILGSLGLFGGIPGSLHLVYSDFKVLKSQGLREARPILGMTKIPANPPDDASISPHAWASSETQKALLYGHAVSRFSVAPLIESIHMLFEQITLDDDSQMTIKLASKIMMRLYASVGSDADTALALLQIGTKCLALDPESFGEKAVDISIAPPNIYPGQAREWLYDEMMATEDAKDQAFTREDRLRSESKRKEPRASGTDPEPAATILDSKNADPTRNSHATLNSKVGLHRMTPRVKSRIPRRSLLQAEKMEWRKRFLEPAAPQKAN